jgi:peptidoglycan L-alanyl-D-glutamate endopeptidase CwlK
MPKFGKRSKGNMKGVDIKLQNVFNEVVKEFDCTVTEGLRSQERQNELVEQGKSKTKFGKHVLGKALDVYPFPVDFKDRDRFHYFGGYVKGVAKSQGVKIRWGGDWDGDFETKDNVFDDLCHFEILDE